jgi:hypothetical protein
VALADPTGDVVAPPETEIWGGPQVGTEELSRAWDATPPWPSEFDPTPRPRLFATGASISTTARIAARASAPLMALMPAVSLRRRRDRLGLIGPLRPKTPEFRDFAVVAELAPPTSSDPVLKP